MIDPHERKQAALRNALKLMGERMAEIGWDKRLNELTPEEATGLAEAAIAGFQEATRASATRPDPEVPF